MSTMTEPAMRAPASLPDEDVPLDKSISAEEMGKGSVKQGWIHKMGAKHKAWRLRWTVVKAGCIFYYKTPQSLRAQGLFSLEGYKIKIQEGGFKRKWVFALVPSGGGGRVWHFSAENLDGMQHWIKEIRQEIHKKFANSPKAYDDDSVSEDDSEENYDEPYDDSILLDDPPAIERPPARPPKPHMIAEDTDYQSSPWFLEGTTREQIATILLDHGSFAVRQKSATSGLALSVNWHGKHRHYKIYEVDSSGFSLGGEESEFFPSVVALVRAYQVKPLPGSPDDDMVLGKAYGT